MRTLLTTKGRLYGFETFTTDNQPSRLTDLEARAICRQVEEVAAVLREVDTCARRTLIFHATV